MRAPETEFEDLEALLREDRPAPDPAWARALDARAAAGFPRERRRRWRWLPSLHLHPALAVAACGLLALTVAVAALTGGGSEDQLQPGGGGSAPSFDGSAGMEDGTASEAAPSGAEPAGGDAAGRATLERSDRQSKDEAAGMTAPVPIPPPGTPGADGKRRRQVERSAELVLASRPRDIDEVAAGVANTATELGGYVAASSVSSQQGGMLDLRVPTARLDRAIDRLSRLAKVRDLARASVDITAEVVSAKSRLRDARTERASLLRQLADAVTVNETESIRARLRIVSRQIEATKAEVRQVKNRASYANVTVALQADRSLGTGGGGGDDGNWTPGDAARDAVRVLEVAAGGALIALAVALPLGLLALLALLASRVLTRRRRERALDLA